jgi:ubiquinone/menaquinone biosynthesis C-methylase UbiE
MSWLVPPRRFDPSVPEMMDRPGQPPDLLRQDLDVLEKINVWLGGQRIALHYLAQFSPPPRTVLDLATGAGDVPRAIAGWARRRSLEIQITAVDANPDILQIARERCAAFPEIHTEAQNILALPYPPRSFDVVLCALTLHHFTEADAVVILRRIGELARVGYVVNDLRRNRTAIWLSKVMARTIITNPIARFDAPASCERAFSVEELRRMAKRAGLENFQIRNHPVFRACIVKTRS